MKDNTSILTLESKLTRIGKQRLSENRFNPTKFAVSDDGINYNLYESSLIDPFIKNKRLPMFNVSRDAASLLKSKLPMGQGFEDQDIVHDYGVSIERVTSDEFEGEVNTVQISGSVKPKQYPEYITGGGKRLKYYITDNDLASLQNNTILNFNFGSLPVQDQNQFITVILHDRKYFDISLSDKNVEQIQTVTNNNDVVVKNFPESVIVDTSKEYTDLPKTINVMCNPNSRLQQLGLGDRRERVRNYIESRFGQSNRSRGNTYQDTLRLMTNQTQNYNSFNLYYKGNFGYKNADTSQYDTMITLFSELTGQYENIHLSIIPTQAP